MNNTDLRDTTRQIDFSRIQTSAMYNGINFYSKVKVGYVAQGVFRNNKIVTYFQPAKGKYRLGDKEKTCIAVILLLLVLFQQKYTLYMSKEIIAISCLYIARHLFKWAKHILTKHGRNQYKYHAADHMIINAVDYLGRIPKLNEAKKYSRFCSGCGTNLTVLFDTFLLFSFYNIAYKNDISFQIAITVAFFMIEFSKMGLDRIFNVFQFFTTIKPTDKELSVGIAALKLWYEKEKEGLNALKI